MISVGNIDDIVDNNSDYRIAGRRVSRYCKALIVLQGYVTPYDFGKFQEGMWAVDTNGNIYEFLYESLSGNMMTCRKVGEPWHNWWVRSVVNSSTTRHAPTGKVAYYNTYPNDLLILIPRNYVQLGR